MIDWLTIKCPPCPGLEVDGGKVVFLNPDGSIDYMIDKFFQVPGSFDDRIGVRAYEGSEVVISGNPTKWLQGHNLFGIEDFSKLFSLFMLQLNDFLHFDKDWLVKVLDGDFQVSRIDLTYSYKLKNQGEVIQWLNAMQQICTGKRQALSRDKGTTVYIGKHSRRSAIKFYDKEGEVKAGYKHGFNEGFSSEQQEFLTNWVKGILRCEVVIRGMALKDEFNLKTGKHFMGLGAKELRAIFMKKLSMVNFPEKMKVTDDDLQHVKPRLRAVYELWQEGYNILDLWPRATAYRYRNEFLREFNVDIFMQSPKEFRKSSQVLPMLRPLEAVPCELPEEAYVLGLLAA